MILPIKFALNLKVDLIAIIYKIHRFSLCKKVAFYTLKLNTRESSEFDDFLIRLNQKLKDKTELENLLKIIETIGTKWGYRQDLFKSEDAAYRFVVPFTLRTNENSNFGLRLYCLVLSEKVIIILNGDIKTEQAVINCSNCLPHFKLSNNAAKAIEKAMDSKYLEINEFDIEIEEDFELEI